jgi:hypothetical protein
MPVVTYLSNSSQPLNACPQFAKLSIPHMELDKDVRDEEAMGEDPAGEDTTQDEVMNSVHESAGSCIWK